jgi:thiol:disulfide interchange protein DsbC
MKKVLDQRNDIAFYLKMMPLVNLHPQAYDKSKAIICEESNEKAIQLLEDVYAKKSIPQAPCDTKVIDENIRLAQKLGISGTPTLIFNDGSRASGAVKAEQLIQMIDQKAR